VYFACAELCRADAALSVGRGGVPIGVGGDVVEEGGKGLGECGSISGVVVEDES